MKQTGRRLGCAMLGCWALAAGAAEPPPVHVVRFDPADSIEERVRKAAHVVPTPIQYAYHRNEFIGFIHWGPNTFSRREWGDGKERADLFHPTGLDTDQWCEAMRDAGIRMVVFVAKHHDGYCLWNTRYTRHSVAASPWMGGRGDVLRSLAESCRKFGLKLGVYLSPADLHQIESPDGLYGNGSAYSDRVIPRAVPGRPFRDTRKFQIRVDDYNEYFLNQLFELLTEYGPIHEVWFDGAHPKRKGDQRYTEELWFRLIRALAPEAAIFEGPDVRWCGNEAGDTRRSEWNVLALKKAPKNFDWDYGSGEDLGSRERLKTAEAAGYRPPEINTSIRAGWFYRDEAQDVRSADQTFDMYERAVGGNGVFMLNIPPNREGRFGERDVAVLREVGRRARATYGVNLAAGAQAPGAEAVLDERPDTAWLAPGATGEFEVRLPAPRRVNRAVLQEDILRHSQRVEAHALDAWMDGAWKEVARATTIGYKRILRFPSVTSDRFRVRITEGRVRPSISSFTLHAYDAPPPAITARRDADGLVRLEPQTTAFHWKGGRPAMPDEGEVQIRYTLDGTEPGTASPLYRQPLALPQGGQFRVRSWRQGVEGPVTTAVIPMTTQGWTLHAVSSEHSAEFAAAKAWDGDPGTYWHTSWNGGDAQAPRHPHHLAIRLGDVTAIGGFTYLPRQDRKIPDAMIEGWAFEVSDDGQTWTRVAEGEFGNIVNDPSLRVERFEKPARARYVRLVSRSGAAGKPYAGAAEFGLLPAAGGNIPPSPPE
ncbi:MAG: alpha-L-fucosidase [Kiritimatiellae bacterium]|nr:alpha-L-fucosidase [Kiritimatiellia bacterium]